MTSRQKLLLLFLGLVSAFLLVSQWVLGELLGSGRGNLRVAHQHTGRTAVIVAMSYVLISLWLVIQATPRERR